MQKLIFTVLLLALSTSAICAPLNLSISYDIDQTAGVGTYGATADRSWQTFDPDDETATGGSNGPLPTAPHLIGVEVFVNGNAVGGVIDDPAHRVIPLTIETSHPRPRLALRMIWLRQPWLANHAYNIGDKISVFYRELIAGGTDRLPATPYTAGYWECTRAGVSGSTEPNWPQNTQILAGQVHLTDGKKHTLFGSVIDNGDGTVTLPIADIHDYQAGDAVTITGMTDYDGTYVLPDQSAGDASHIVITHAFTAELLAYPQAIYLTAGVAVDNGDGTVTIPAIGHGLVIGDSVTLWGSGDYDGTYVLPDQSAADSNHFIITHTFTSTIFNQSAVAYKAPVAVDNGDDTVTLPVAGHGLSQGDIIDINGTVAYDGTYTLPAQTLGDADHLVITAIYSAETFTGNAYLRTRVQDADNSGVEWQRIFDAGNDIVARSLFTGRVIVKDNGNGQAVQTGTSYIIRHAP